MRATRLSHLPRVAARIVLLLHFASGLAPARADDGIHVESSRHAGVVEIRASADLVADRDTAWRILTDYGRYAAFIPGMKESRVVSRNGATVLVEQAGTAALGPLHIPIEITFQILETPPGAIESRAVAGTLEALESRYTLSVRGQGSRLLYSGRVRPGFPLFGGLGQSAIEANVAGQFHALVDEIERQYRGEPATSTDARR
jgi:carbon monoxide dehydrogenase subunit G